MFLHVRMHGGVLFMVLQMADCVLKRLLCFPKCVLSKMSKCCFLKCCCYSEIVFIFKKAFSLLNVLLSDMIPGWRHTSASLRLVSPPNKTVTSSGALVIALITSDSCLIRSAAKALQLSKCDVIRENFWPLNSTWVWSQKRWNQVFQTAPSQDWLSSLSTNLSNEQVPHHSTEWKVVYLAVQQGDSWLLQHHCDKVTLFTSWWSGGNRGKVQTVHWVMTLLCVKLCTAGCSVLSPSSLSHMYLQWTCSLPPDGSSWSGRMVGWAPEEAPRQESVWMEGGDRTDGTVSEAKSEPSDPQNFRNSGTVSEVLSSPRSPYICLNK